nr:MAG TPA: hypothetical protein [Caudoviricetes sp.]
MPGPDPTTTTNRRGAETAAPGTTQKRRHES